MSVGEKAVLLVGKRVWIKVWDGWTVGEKTVKWVDELGKM